MKLITAGDGDPRHGTMNGYQNHRCRCDDCKSARSEFGRSDAQREYLRIWRANRAARGINARGRPYAQGGTT